MTDRIHELLNFWFGSPGSADLPSSERTSLWFGENAVVKQQLLDTFSKEYEEATKGNLIAWGKTPRGRLALIIILDQFSRYIHRHDALAFAFDKQAQELCFEGLQMKMDQSLTLIERVFFYMPLVHSENEETQEKSIRLYQELVTL
ncbi:MAG: DUF924 domain-containing protein, partial [Gammaproteobacteria bacterium]|nr:DUF924 domain-containing protein [Gammaproteobacteria bacterium]